MGGTSGEVRGDRKIDAYLAYVEKCEAWDGDHSPEPQYKKCCYREMERDDETGEWVLWYHFHT